jgi:hypothetical protein
MSNETKQTSKEYTIVIPQKDFKRLKRLYKKHVEFDLLEQIESDFKNTNEDE